MLTDSMADSRAAAVMMPTGPTATQAQDRARAAGTDGPPPKAPTRTDPADRTRGSGERPITFDRDARGSALARQVIEAQMLPLPDTGAPDRAAGSPDPARKADERLAELARAAFAENQAIVRKTQDERAATMRIAM